tara:strand:+ start:24730 stop:25101 length:372 start_codon:yes stop_codon:yes gene_type:complete
MRYRYVTVDNLVVLTLEGEVELESWRRCFLEMEHLFVQNGFDRLMIDGSGLIAFNLSHNDCRAVSPGFVAYARKAAIYSDNPLIFGMMRVIHSYAFNEQFRVYKTKADASAYLSDRQKQSQCA